MNKKEIVDKLWNLCHVLRDDGITYHQYVIELTYILFLKMAKETNTDNSLPEGYRWENLLDKNENEIKFYYRDLLEHLGKEGVGKIKEIFDNAYTSIDEPKNLKKIINTINDIDWYSAKEEGLGNLYEGLLEKNASEKKSGAGQYFTPRPLIEVMVELIKPEPGEKLNDPACGTFGFMVYSNKYMKDKYNGYLRRQKDFQSRKAFSGCELVKDTHRLALMNALLHEIDGQILLGDALSFLGKQLNGYDVILSNPPFGTKKGGERPTRDDLGILTSKKQLNFLQHIYRSLRSDTGTARAAIILPDNVLFQDGEGQKIRSDLMNQCELHTVLRLPAGIFYAQGVKTNVIFLRKSKTDKDNTKEVWFYDMRTGMESLGKRNPLKYEHFINFIKAYQAKDRRNIPDKRWNVYTRDEIFAKNDSLDFGLINSNGNGKHLKQEEPIKIMKNAMAELNLISKEMTTIINELNRYGN